MKQPPKVKHQRLAIECEFTTYIVYEHIHALSGFKITESQIRTCVFRQFERFYSLGDGTNPLMVYLRTMHLRNENT